MAGNKIKLKDQLGRVVRVGGDTTPGATVGRDLRWPDGTIVKLSEIKNPAVDSSTGGMAPTIWKLVREIPANIQKLAKLAGVGFATRGADGEWHQRKIEAGEGIEVENGDGVAGNPAVALADVPDAGGGTLQKTAFDAKGRKTGTSAATTDDLPEGADNLYFTTARAAAAAPVQSVNDQTGDVELTAADVGADPAGAAVGAIAAHVAEADPHHQYQLELPAGTTGQFLRGDGVFSNEIQGPIRVVANPAAPGMLSGLFGAYVAGPDGAPIFGMYDAFGQGTGLLFRRCNGTAAAPTALAANSLIGQFQARGHDGAGYSSAETVAVWFESDGAWSSTSHPGRIAFFTTPAGAVTPARRLIIESAGAISPGADNTQSLGIASRRYSVVYAGTGTINTSDAREKTTVRPFTPAELAAGAELGRGIGVYQWLEMVEAKGDAARMHIGLTVQEAIAVLESHGLDPFAYGFICYDEWDELPEIRDEEGVVTQECRLADNRYSFRMDELLAFIARGLAHRLDSMEQRLTAAGL